MRYLSQSRGPANNLGLQDLENTAPRIKSDYKAPHDDLIQGQKRKQRRKERKLKRIVAALGGYTVMGWMIYLIMVTARTVPKIWDPYDILGVSRVSCRVLRLFFAPALANSTTHRALVKTL